MRAFGSMNIFQHTTSIQVPANRVTAPVAISPTTALISTAKVKSYGCRIDFENEADARALAMSILTANGAQMSFDNDGQLVIYTGRDATGQRIES